MASHLCIEHDVVWGGLLSWELEALKATEYKEESQKMALFHVVLSVDHGGKPSAKWIKTIKRLPVHGDGASVLKLSGIIPIFK